MRTGRLCISRGHQLPESAAGPRLALVPRADSTPPAATAVVAAPPSPGYQSVHDRLSALERLVRLYEQGALSADEFAAEKIFILGLPADELVLVEAAAIAPPPVRGPSLVGRLFSWRFLPVGLAAGLALSYASQPDDTIRFFDEALRLFGA